MIGNKNTEGIHSFKSLLMLFRNTSYRLLIEGIDYDHNPALPPFIVIPRGTDSTHPSEQDYRPLVSDFHVSNYQVRFQRSVRSKHHRIARRISSKHNLPLQGVSLLATLSQKHVRNTEGFALDKVTLRGDKLGGAMLTKSRCQDLQDTLHALNIKYTRLDLGWACIIFIDNSNMNKLAAKYQALLHDTSRRGFIGGKGVAKRLPTRVERSKSQYLLSVWGSSRKRSHLSVSSVLAFIVYLPSITMELLLKYLLSNTFASTKDAPHSRHANLLYAMSHFMGAFVVLGGYYYLLLSGVRYLFDRAYMQSITHSYLHTTVQYLSDTSIVGYLTSVNLSRFVGVVDSYIVSAYIFLGSEVFLLDISSRYLVTTLFAVTLLLLGMIPMLRYYVNAILGFAVIIALTLPAVVIAQMLIIHGSSSMFSVLQATALNVSAGEGAITGASILEEGLASGMISDTALGSILAPLLTLSGAMLFSTLILPAAYIYVVIRLTGVINRRYIRYQPTYDLSWLK